MGKQSDKLVNHLTDSLAGNPEAQLATRHLLTERFASVEPEAIEQELEKFQNPPQGKRTLFLRKYRVPLFLGLNLLLLLALALPIFIKAPSTLPVLKGRSWTGWPSEEPDFSSIKNQLTEEEDFFVFGDSGIYYESNKFLPYLKNNPRNPAALSLYLLESIKAEPELYRLGEELEPDNSFYPLLEAAQALEPTIEQHHRYRRGGSAKTSRWVITKPEVFNNAMAQMEEAIRLPRYQNYTRENLARRLAILPDETNLHSRQARQFIKFSQGWDRSLDTFTKAFDAKAEELLKNNEFEQLQELFDLSIRLPLHYSSGSLDSWSVYVVVSYWETLSKIFSRPNLRKHLSNSQQAQLQAIVDEANFLRKMRNDSFSFKETDSAALGAGPMADFFFFGCYFSLATPPTAQELAPERLYWQAALERVTAFMMATLFILFSLICSAPFRKKKSFHQVALHFDRSTSTARLVSYSALIAATGLSVHFLITRFTPLGDLGRSWLTFSIFPQGPHLLTLAVFILILAISLARHLVRQRLASLNLATPLHWISWWPLLLALLCYPLSNLLAFFENSPNSHWEDLADYFEQIPLLILSVFSLWLISLLFKTHTGDGINRLSNKLIFRYTAYLLFVPTLVAIFATSLLRLNEIKWFKRDHFLSTNEYPYALSRFDSDINLALHQRQKDLQQKLTELRAQAPPQ